MEMQQQTPPASRRKAVKVGAVAMAVALAGIVAGGTVATDASAKPRGSSAQHVDATPHADETPRADAPPHAEPTAGAREGGRHSGGSRRRN